MDCISMREREVGRKVLCISTREGERCIMYVYVCTYEGGSYVLSIQYIHVRCVYILSHLHYSTFFDFGQKFGKTMYEQSVFFTITV